MFVRTCPKCAHVRKDTETAPAWQCPACGIVYAKYGETAVHHHEDADAPTPSPIMVGGKPLLTNRNGRGLNFVQIAGLIVIAGAVAVSGYSKLVHRSPAHAVSSAENQAAPVAILYATSWCPYCKQTRKLLERDGVKYTEIDVEKDPHSQDHLRQKFHVSGFPILEVDGEIVVGYKPAEIEKLVAGAQRI
ncbi:MAG TPA: glutaredoxin family protein [Burkholderiales bacterium]|jgi:glutaredoxin|nr:glutaredoxin family protein [Burkholderiales bacterium]